MCKHTHHIIIAKVQQCLVLVVGLIPMECHLWRKWLEYRFIQRHLAGHLQHRMAHSADSMLLTLHAFAHTSREIGR